jgi:AmmeMemoRadiSam system protein B
VPHSDKNIVRPPAVAGMFYDDSPELLRKSITGFLERARVPKLNGTVRAVVSPHAGYVYSGFTAAHAYKLIAGNNYDCVIVVGPSHREYFDGISIYPGDAYETPLGTIPIHKEIRAELLNEKKAIIASKAGHGSEHSIEVQLPFLQSVLSEIAFVPMIMGDQRSELCSDLAETLARVAKDRNILLVASSDLSHFHDYNEAVKLDDCVIEKLKDFNSKNFINDLEKNIFEACGGGPIAAIMEAAEHLGAKKAEILHYCNSGDITGDKSTVVGYLAAAFL